MSEMPVEFVKSSHTVRDRQLEGRFQLIVVSAYENNLKDVF